MLAGVLLVQEGGRAMKRIPVFFATKGTPTHCRDDCLGPAGTGISERSGIHLRSEAPYDWSTAVNAVVGASLHAGRHQACAGKFVRREAQHLNARPAGFLLGESQRRIAQSNRGGCGRRYRLEISRATGWQPQPRGLLPGQAGIYAIRLPETVDHAPHRRARRRSYRHRPGSRPHGLGGSTGNSR